MKKKIETKNDGKEFERFEQFVSEIIKVPKEVKVSFVDQYGNRVSFKATKRVSVPVKVTFYKKRKKR